MTENTSPNIDELILSKFRRDSLCSKCGGPIEINRISSCWKCDIIPHIRTQLDWIDTASMNMSYQLGIREKPQPVRETTPEPQQKPKSTPIKKSKPKKSQLKTTNRKGR